MDCSPPDFSVRGIFQARILEWVAILPPGDLPNPRIESRFPALQVDSLPSEPPLKLLVIALCSSPGKFRKPSNLMGSSSGVMSFCLFILSMRFSRHEFWSGLPFSPLADCVLSELSTMTCPSWVALHGMAHGSMNYASLFATTKLSSMKGVFNLYLNRKQLDSHIVSNSYII